MKAPKFCVTLNMVLRYLMLLLAPVVATRTAQAQTYTVLHTFHGKNGAGPSGPLMRDKSGNLYGTTEGGGLGKCKSGFDNWCGVAYKLDKTGKQVWLHSFRGSNGNAPQDGVILGPGGNLYGTTYLGGDTDCYKFGCGTVFKLNPEGKEKRLYQFTGTPDGWFTSGPVARDSAGNLYGTTQEGGAFGGGSVYKLDRSGTETVLYSFTCYQDGCNPNSGVTLDAVGNMYGVTSGGGSGQFGGGYGVVYKLDPAGNFSLVHTFDGADGANPIATLVLDAQGSLYGTTLAGGNSDVCNGGCGTVFKISPDGQGHWTEAVVYSFCSQPSCKDGMAPYAGVVRDNDGNLYGTTAFGGQWPCAGVGCGVVFKVDPSGNETLLYQFRGGKDGFQPDGPLLRAFNGVIYGVATGGGDKTCYPSEGCGVVFRITP